jgi:hypothetical protein
MRTRRIKDVKVMLSPDFYHGLLFYVGIAAMQLPIGFHRFVTIRFIPMLRILIFSPLSYNRWLSLGRRCRRQGSDRS